MAKQFHHDLKTINKPKEIGQYLFLSLFLLLLSFFALLNALATVEETKARDVLTSLAATFRSAVEPETSAEIRISSLEATSSPEDLLKELERLWVKQVVVAKAKVLSPGQDIQLVLPANELFLGGEAIVRSDRKDLIRNVARTLSVQAAGFTIHVQIVLGSEAISEEQLQQKETLAMARAAAFAVALLGFGAPEKGISIGIRRGDRSKIRMRFVIRERALPKVDFQHLAQ